MDRTCCVASVMAWVASDVLWTSIGVSISAYERFMAVEVCCAVMEMVKRESRGNQEREQEDARTRRNCIRRGTRPRIKITNETGPKHISSDSR